ncbi:MAG: type II/IV secretion system ATPase subunit [Thaumarchaeota archaeon]|nr:type II/IV secretion system ATPase subunit [Nitrososphaerota archaeon]MBI3641148.1 type II/IV secretion system ATPase subunit [Nitrososphaerota archaeon]
METRKTTFNISIIEDSNFVDALKKSPHLFEYVSIYVNRGLPLPTFVKSLEYKHRSLDHPNLIYPIPGDVFIHINPHAQLADGYKEYIIIEPPEPERVLLNVADQLFSNHAGSIVPPIELTERFNVIENYINKTVTISKNPVLYEKLNASKIKTLPVYEKDLVGFKYHFLRRRAGMDILDPYLSDPYLEDVSIVGAGNIYVVHKFFGALKAITFLSNEEIDDLIIGMAEQFGKTISHARPVIDAQLSEGSRINIVYGKDVSKKGTNATIRRFANTPLAITEIIQSRTMSSAEAAYLWMMLSEGMSLFINGETASGKTTSLMALTAFIPANLKIVTLEDTAEITLAHQNWISEVTRDSGNTASNVTMFDLLKAALRQRPNYIIMGEIRGAEGNTAFQAMQTGHPVISTFHAANMVSLLQRITNPPIGVPKTHIENLNIAVFQGAVQGPDGKRIRRVLTVNEIIGYNSDVDKVMYVPLFNWEPFTDTVKFRGKGSSALFKTKILQNRGLSKRDEVVLYDELTFRAKILDKMIDKKIFNFYDVYESISRCGEIGLDAFYRELEQI